MHHSRTLPASPATLALRSGSAARTAELGALLAPLLRPGDVLPLWGEFGAGKTTFVQGVGRALGIGRPLVSPSFGLLHVYRDGGLPLYHLDLYRVGSAEEAEAFGVEEALGGDGAALVEWPAVIEELLPRDRLDVYLGHSPGETRTLRFEARGARFEALLAAYRRLVEKG